MRHESRLENPLKKAEKRFRSTETGRKWDNFLKVAAKRGDFVGWDNDILFIKAVEATVMQRLGIFPSKNFLAKPVGKHKKMRLIAAKKYHEMRRHD